ncbi:Phage integrase family protein [Pricia antarctica]|uniref:Phage integrase family protein n=1 Tax=Pricia antarctica TaxID=641691 RepID=A0A1G7G804_9FLAO|nr:site-specific integrase [Pricia antarctica]SDE84227.1 Phage integrase family protein [Pricia antarctica]
MAEMRIFDREGNRLYCTQEEVALFLKKARERDSNLRTFAETLVYTGCRISEGLSLTPKGVNRDSCQITFNSLKKRRGDLYRTVPVPVNYIDTLTVANKIVERQKVKKKAESRIWTWSRQYAFRLIKELMIDAGIPEGKHRSPKGLRHAFGVNAVVKGVQLNMIMKWMGHADISTTAIYADAIGKEEAEIAKKMWV